MSIRALVVGGTSGVGYGMACRLAAQAPSSSVIISGRTKPSSIPHANIDFRPLDASSMRQIKQYTDTLKSTLPGKLDYLVMTQGIMTTGGRDETPEGIDRKMALHTYGKQLLIRELLPILSDDAKVIVVLDSLAGSPTKLIWDDLDLKTHFTLGKAADHCTSMNDAMVQYFAAEQKASGTTARRHFVHAYPGLVKTAIGRDLPWYLRHPANAIFSLAAVSPETSGKFLVDGAQARTKEAEAEGRFWSNIDNKGNLVKNKAAWTEEQVNRVAQHTWEIVDGALKVSV